MDFEIDIIKKHKFLSFQMISYLKNKSNQSLLAQLQLQIANHRHIYLQCLGDSYIDLYNIQSHMSSVAT